MFDLYVYYKVRAENAARLEPLVRVMQARLAQRLSGAVQLKRRPEARDGLQTWMEVYQNADEAFRAALEHAGLDAGLAGLVEGPRHTEVFTDLTPCA
jgi:hypothetical protein